MPTALKPPAIRRTSGGTPIVAAATIGLLLFLWTASEVVGGASGLDDAVLWAFRVGHDPLVPIGPAWLTSLVRLLSAASESAILLVVATVVAVLLARRGRPKAAAVLLVAGIGAAAICFVIKELFDRSRPDVAFRLVGETGASFPSTHAMLSLVIGGMVALLLSEPAAARHTRAILCVAAALVSAVLGVSRLYLGVHFATDVVAGWSLGLAWLLSVWLAATTLGWTRN